MFIKNIKDCIKTTLTLFGVKRWDVDVIQYCDKATYSVVISRTIDIPMDVLRVSDPLMGIMNYLQPIMTELQKLDKDV